MSGEAPSAQAMPLAGANPFSPRAALVLVAFGAAVFVALLYMIGAGTGGASNDGGGHAGGRGLNGYAALAGFLDRRGFDVRRLRDPGSLDDPGVLVLTPPASADGAEIDKVVRRHRYRGATVVVTPKWLAAPASDRSPGYQRGWVAIAGVASPRWQGFLDDVGVAIGPLAAPNGAMWRADGIAGTLPQPKVVQSGRGLRLVPLVRGQDGRVLAAYLQDDGFYPVLEGMAGRESSSSSEPSDVQIYPLILVFEPDLIDNWGMARAENARLADRLFRAAVGDRERAVLFDLTLNGLGRRANLLTLAFTPPFLAATLCLLIAALAVGWRAFLRFGPPRAGTRAIAFGKRALVANAAGLIRRSRRLHLITAPYAARARERLGRALGLARQADAAASEAAIDRAALARHPDATPFSVVAARLRAARSPHDILKAAQDLHALERTLIR